MAEKEHNSGGRTGWTKLGQACILPVITGGTAAGAFQAVSGTQNTLYTILAFAWGFAADCFVAIPLSDSHKPAWQRWLLNCLGLAAVTAAAAGGGLYQKSREAGVHRAPADKSVISSLRWACGGMLEGTIKWEATDPNDPSHVMMMIDCSRVPPLPAAPQ